MASGPLSRARVAAAAVAAALALATGPAGAGAGQGDDYKGVAPGKARTQPPASEGTWARLTWLGFQPRPGGGARVFAQLGREVGVQQEIVDGQLWVMLEHVRPGANNALRALDVRFFDSPLATVDADRSRRRRARDGKPAVPAGTKIVVSFKSPEDAARAEASVVREDDGYAYLYLDFAPGTSGAVAPQGE